MEFDKQEDDDALPHCHRSMLEMMLEAKSSSLNKQTSSTDGNQ
jgi:hypothetical protein